MRLHLGVLDLMRYGAVALSAIGIMTIVSTLGTGDTIVSRLFAKYTNHLDKTLRLLFREGSGKTIAKWQGGIIVAVLAVEASVIDVPYWYVIVVLVAIMPAVRLDSERKSRVAKLEFQVDGFILALANSMKTVPGPAAALQAVVPVLPNPTRQEIDRVIKEMRVGNTLEQAIVNMSSRIGSKTMDSALSSLLVGLQVGGNLPAVLETAAATIREMNRLDGVVRTKTSEGKAQLWVLAAFPFVICIMFNWVQPGYFDPLQTSVTGYAIMALAMIFWVASLIVARKVLTVDI